MFSTSIFATCNSSSTSRYMLCTLEWLYRRTCNVHYTTKHYCNVAQVSALCTGGMYNDLSLKASHLYNIDKILSCEIVGIWNINNTMVTYAGVQIAL